MPTNFNNNGFGIDSSVNNNYAGLAANDTSNILESNFQLFSQEIESFQNVRTLKMPLSKFLYEQFILSLANNNEVNTQSGSLASSQNRFSRSVNNKPEEEEDEFSDDIDRIIKEMNSVSSRRNEQKTTQKEQPRRSVSPAIFPSSSQTSTFRTQAATTDSSTQRKDPIVKKIFNEPYHGVEENSALANSYLKYFENPKWYQNAFSFDAYNFDTAEKRWNGIKAILKNPLINSKKYSFNLDFFDNFDLAGQELTACLSTYILLIHQKSRFREDKWNNLINKQENLIKKHYVNFKKAINNPQTKQKLAKKNASWFDFFSDQDWKLLISINEKNKQKYINKFLSQKIYKTKYKELLPSHFALEFHQNALQQYCLTMKARNIFQALKVYLFCLENNLTYNMQFKYFDAHKIKQLIENFYIVRNKMLKAPIKIKNKAIDVNKTIEKLYEKWFIESLIAMNYLKKSLLNIPQQNYLPIPIYNVEEYEIFQNKNFADPNSFKYQKTVIRDLRLTYK